MMWYYNGHMSGWGWLLMGTGVVLFWAVVITALVLLVRYLNRTANDGRDGSEPTAAEILARRFARGEISEEEFLARSKLLRH